MSREQTISRVEPIHNPGDKKMMTGQLDFVFITE